MRRYFLQAALLTCVLLQSWTPLQAGVNRYKVVYWKGPSVEKKIALTFDDGPNEPYTSEVLKILADNHVPATFFLVGKNVETYPETVRAIAEAGHVIGNHGYTHKNLVTHSNGRVRQEILQTESAIEKVTGHTTYLFRPAYGEKNTLTVQQMRRLGYVMVQWSISAEDWRKPGPEKIARNVLKKIRGGDIILMHDGDKARHGSDRSQTVAALPGIIAELKAQGFEFVTVPDLLKLDMLEPIKTAWRLTRDSSGTPKKL